MLEITTTRHNPLVDPVLDVWTWQIPVYLFIGGMVAGMMVLAGVQMLRAARGDDTRLFFSVQTPILGIVLLSLGMGALFLDLEHKLHVLRVYMTFEPLSPMSWGSWVLLLVYPVLAASALIRLDEAWPWLARMLPIVKTASNFLVRRPGLVSALGWANILLGIGLGIYTGVLLNTMVARPLWNSAVLGPLFLFSGLSAGAAMVHLATSVLPGTRPAPQGAIDGAWAALAQPLGPQYPRKDTTDWLIRADVGFLAIEIVLIALLVIGLLSGSASQIAAARMIIAGKYAAVFWGVIIAMGILLPLALQALEANRRIRHTVMPALLVLAGGFALRWVMVVAGQESHVVRAAGF